MLSGAAVEEGRTMSEKMRLPKFKLERVYSDGGREEPELHGISGIDTDCRMGRRGFLLTSAVGAGALAALSSGCGTPFAGGRSSGREPREVLGALITPNKSVRADGARGVKAHLRAVLALAFSPDGKTLASTSEDKTLKLWSIPEGRPRKTHKLQREALSLAFAPERGTLFSGMSDGVTVFWKSPFDKAHKTLRAYDSETILSIAMSPDGKTLAVVLKRQGLRFSALPGGDLETKAGGNYSAVAFSPDGKMLACVSGVSDSIELRAFPSGETLAQWKTRERVKFLVFSPEGNVLAGRGPRAMRVWSLPSGEQRKAIDMRQMPSDREGLAFGPDAKWLAAASDSRVYLLKKPYEAPMFELTGFSARVGPLAISRDGRFLAAGARDGSILLWKMPDEEDKADFIGALFDPEASEKNVNVVQYTGVESRSYLLPCGSPLPPGAVCTCNCVSGRYTPPPRPKPAVRPGGGGYGGSICRCNRICTCVPIK
jgi:WD40 repeat protein